MYGAGGTVQVNGVCLHYAAAGAGKPAVLVHGFGDLYWCGLARADALTAYVKRLRRALAEADIPFDRKRFSPHITLLRKATFDRMPGITVPEASMTAERSR